MKHAYSYFYNGGKGLGGVKIPCCTCGWQGKAVNNYNSDQHGMLKIQFNNHLKGAKDER